MNCGNGVVQLIGLDALLGSAWGSLDALEPMTTCTNRPLAGKAWELGPLCTFECV